MYKIYKLILEGKVVYVGRTKMTLKKRKSGGYGKNTEILKESFIELIEETDDISRERYWINHYKDLGYELLNFEKGDGLDYKQYRKQYYEKNKEYFKEYQKEYYKGYYENNKDSKREYYEKNKERIKEYRKEYDREYYEKNKENVVKQQLEYQKKNEEKIKEYRRQYYKEYNKKKNDQKTNFKKNI